MFKIMDSLRALKGKIQERSRRRQLWKDALYLIRLQQMEASFAKYTRDLEKRVAEQAREIRELTAARNEATMVAIDAELDLRASRKTEFPIPSPWRPSVSRG